MAAIPEIENEIQNLCKSKATKDEVMAFEEKVTLYYLMKEDFVNFKDNVKISNKDNKMKFEDVD